MRRSTCHPPTPAMRPVRSRNFSLARRRSSSALRSVKSSIAPTKPMTASASLRTGRARAQQAHPGVRPPDAELHVQLALVRGRVAPGPHDPLAVVLVQHLRPAIAQPLAVLQPVDLPPTRVRVGSPALRVGEKDPQRRRFGQGPEPGLAVAQRDLREPQRGDVGDLDGEAVHPFAVPLEEVADAQVQRHTLRRAAGVLEGLLLPGQCAPHVRFMPAEAVDAEDLRHRQADDLRRHGPESARVRQVGEPASQGRVVVGQHHGTRSSRASVARGSDMRETFLEWTTPF